MQTHQQNAQRSAESASGRDNFSSYLEIKRREWQKFWTKTQKSRSRNQFPIAMHWSEVDQVFKWRVVWTKKESGPFSMPAFFRSCFHPGRNEKDPSHGRLVPSWSLIVSMVSIVYYIEELVEWGVHAATVEIPDAIASDLIPHDFTNDARRGQVKRILSWGTRQNASGRV